MNLIDWISQKTGMTQAETGELSFFLLFVSGSLLLIFCYWLCQPPKRKPQQESQTTKKVEPKWAAKQQDWEERLKSSLTERDRRVISAERTAIRDQYHCTRKGEEPMNSVAFYDKAGNMVGCVSMDWENSEADIHVGQGCSATKSDNGKLTVIRLPPFPSSASSPDWPNTVEVG